MLSGLSGDNCALTPRDAPSVIGRWGEVLARSWFCLLFARLKRRWSCEGLASTREPTALPPIFCPAKRTESGTSSRRWTSMSGNVFVDRSACYPVHHSKMVAKASTRHTDF